LLGVTLLGSCSGCLFTRHTTNVVRQNEALRPVRFESEQAQSVFEAGVAETKSRKEGSNPRLFAIPFVLWYSRVDAISDNAAHNDAAALCDANGDGLITLQEALAYSARFPQEKAKVTESHPGQVEAVSAEQPLAAPLPQTPPR